MKPAIVNKKKTLQQKSVSRAVALQDNRPQKVYQFQSKSEVQEDKKITEDKISPGITPIKNSSSPAPVVQPAWSGAVTGSLFGGVIGSMLGGPLGALVLGGAGAIGGHYLQQLWQRRGNAPAPAAFDRETDEGSFAANLQGRAAFNSELENYINVENEYNEQDETLYVSNPRLNTAGQRLNEREQAQRNYVRNALEEENEEGPSIFDDTIDEYGEKNALWRNLLPGVDSGRNTDNEPMDPDVKLKVKTSLAQIIGTASGFDLMRQVQSLSEELGVLIDYLEGSDDGAYNLKVNPVYEDDEEKVLKRLTVRLPPDPLYNDAQSFKRVSNIQEDNTSDLINQGRRISPSPVDSDLFHEFSHAAHYLRMEARRKGNNDLAETDHAAYDLGYGKELPVVDAQDDPGEARAIHRNNSFANLREIILGQVKGPVEGDPDMESVRAMETIEEFTRDVPAENDFRNSIGLTARQDHHALRRTAEGGYRQVGSYPIVGQ